MSNKIVAISGGDTLSMIKLWKDTRFNKILYEAWNVHFTPHCDENRRQESTKEQLKENGLVGIMLSKCAALEIIDNRYRMIISDSKNNKSESGYGLKAYWNKNEYKEEKINISNNFREMRELLSKC